MQATDRIRDKTKPLKSILISAPTYSSTKIYQMPITNTCANTFFSCLFSSIIGILTLTAQRSEEKQACLIKESTCFSCKEECNITYDCPKKEKITATLESVSEDSKSQEKEQLLSKSRKKACLFLYYLCQKTYFVRVVLLFSVHYATKSRQ